MDEKSKNLFLGLYQMILSDREVHPKELEVLYQIGKEKGGISEEEIQKSVFSPNNLKSLDQFSDEERIEYLYNLARIAWADKKLDKREQEMLEDTVIRLGFSEKNANEISDFLLEQAKANSSFDKVLETIKNS